MFLKLIIFLFFVEEKKYASYRRRFSLQLCQLVNIQSKLNVLEKLVWHPGYLRDTCFSFRDTWFCTFPADTATLWQRCDDVLVDVITTFCEGRKWKLRRRQFPTLRQRRCTTLPRRWYKVDTTSLQHQPIVLQVLFNYG